MKAPGLARPSEAHDAIAQQAADYFERRNFGKWTEADQVELDAWFAQSILHEVSYLRVAGIAAHTERLGAYRPFKPGRDERSEKWGSVRGWIAYPLLAAAAIALFFAYENPILNFLAGSPDRAYATDVGGRTLLTFADHTQIELDTNTLVRFRVTGEERTVWLDRGAAWFHVAHNAANPFSVIVGKHRVTDLGTEFLVRRGPDTMEVALLNGRAVLSTEGAQTATLKPGDDADATAVSMSITRKTPQELADELAWRRGMLVFRKARLADVVHEFNRYNQTKLVIADPSISDVKITADLKTDDYEGFLQLAQAVLNLRVDRQGNDILISRGSREKTKKAAHLNRSL